MDIRNNENLVWIGLEMLPVHSPIFSVDLGVFLGPSPNLGVVLILQSGVAFR